MYKYYKVPKSKELDEKIEELKLWTGIKTNAKALVMLINFGHKFFNK